MHFIQFDHWPLRWLYFLGGLTGCVMIATGSLFWMRARIATDGAEPVKVHVSRGLTVGATTGIVMATGAFLAVNRLLPRDAAFAGYDRSDLEVWAFFLVWIATFIHAALREARAWTEQALAIAALGFAAAVYGPWPAWILCCLQPRPSPSGRRCACARPVVWPSWTGRRAAAHRKRPLDELLDQRLLALSCIVLRLDRVFASGAEPESALARGCRRETTGSNRVRRARPRLDPGIHHAAVLRSARRRKLRCGLMAAIAGGGRLPRLDGPRLFARIA